MSFIKLYDEEYYDTLREFYYNHLAKLISDYCGLRENYSLKIDDYNDWIDNNSISKEDWDRIPVGTTIRLKEITYCIYLRQEFHFDIDTHGYITIIKGRQFTEHDKMPCNFETKFEWYIRVENEEVDNTDPIDLTNNAPFDTVVYCDPRNGNIISSRSGEINSQLLFDYIDFPDLIDK